MKRRCDELLGNSLAEELDGYIGVLELQGSPFARRSREVFGDAVSEKLSPEPGGK